MYQTDRYEQYSCKDRTGIAEKNKDGDIITWIESSETMEIKR